MQACACGNLRGASGKLHGGSGKMHGASERGKGFNMENFLHHQQMLTDAPTKSTEMKTPALGIIFDAGRWKKCCSVAAISGWRLIKISKNRPDSRHTPVGKLLRIAQQGVDPVMAEQVG